MSHKENRKLILGNSTGKSFKYPIYYFLSILKGILSELVLALFPKEFEKKKYMFCICTCFKNESPNLKEWIEYHKLIGVDHFYLYNNNSNDNFQEVLAPYIAENIVTLIDFPQTPVQPYCYEHWIKNFRSESSWVALIDVDEYFVPLRVNNIKDWLKKWQKYPIILVYWKMFGTSGRIEHDDNKLITEQYTNSWPKLYDCGKVILNTEYDFPISIGMMHSTSTKYRGLNISPINVWRKYVNYGIHRYSRKEIDIQLNHYWSGSYSKYVEKQARGDSAYTLPWKNFDAFLAHEQHNSAVDMSIYRFLIQLKLKMMGKYPES